MRPGRLPETVRGPHFGAAVGHVFRLLPDHERPKSDPTKRTRKSGGETGEILGAHSKRRAQVPPQIASKTQPRLFVGSREKSNDPLQTLSIGLKPTWSTIGRPPTNPASHSWKLCVLCPFQLFSADSPEMSAKIETVLQSRPARGLSLQDGTSALAMSCVSQQRPTPVLKSSGLQMESGGIQRLISYTSRKKDLLQCHLPGPPGKGLCPWASSCPTLAIDLACPPKKQGMIKPSTSSMQTIPKSTMLPQEAKERPHIYIYI